MPTQISAPTDLTGAHLRTFQTIFQHPASHNLGWHDVHALFRHLGQMEEAANGNFKVSRNGETLVLPPARTKDVSTTDDLMTIRHFLQRSEKAVSLEMNPQARCLLLINHHEARIFHSDNPGTVPEVIPSHQAADTTHVSHASKEFSRGEEKPDPNHFFTPVAVALQAAGQILIFGSGSGTANERDQFVAWLNVHRADLARRVVGTQIVDEHHLTDAQLLAKARDFYAIPEAAEASAL